MSFIPKKPTSFSLLILCLFLCSQYPSNGVLEDPTSFVFQHCSTEKLDDSNGEYSKASSTLVQRLIFQSSQSKFNMTSVMVGDHSVDSVSGLFQCRGDLDDHKCNECMKAIQNVSSGLCGNSMAARIQLSGCHVQYKADGYENPTPADHEVHHKICGEPQAIVASELFEEVRSKAFEALEAEVGDEGVHLGFYEIKHEGVQAMVQCDVGIGECKCAKCVADAVHVVEEECHGSSWGQVFLELCYLGYEFHPHEVHVVAIHPEKTGLGSIAKLVALAVGGVAVLAVAFLCCRFCRKKEDDL